MRQLSLDFTPRCVTGKKLKRVTIACSDEFKNVVAHFCNLTGQTESELGMRYFIDGMKKDLGNIPTTILIVL